MKKIIFISIIIFIFIPMILNAEKIRIAVVDFKEIELSKNTALTVTEMIRTEMSNIANFTIIERSQMDEILKEQGFQQTGCTDVSCAVEIGKILSAQKILVGTVTKFETQIIINGRIVDVEKSVSEIGHTSICYSENDLLPTVISFTENITKKYHTEKKLYSSQPPEINPEKHDFIIKVGYDIYSKHIIKYDKTQEIETDINKDFSLGIEYYYSFKNFISLGLGCILQKPRKVKKTTSAQFSVTPFYFSIRLKYPHIILSPFLTGNIGYARFGDTDEYANTRGGTVANDINGEHNSNAYYYSLGIGSILYKNIIFEITYQRYTGNIKVSTHDISSIYWTRHEDEVIYSRFVLSAGFLF